MTRLICTISFKNGNKDRANAFFSFLDQRKWKQHRIVAEFDSQYIASDGL